MATICVINDNHAQDTVLAELLTDRECDDVLSYNSIRAFDQLKRRQVDLIVLDVLTKTREGGWDFPAFLRQHPRLRSLPVIVCTAADNDFLAKREWLRNWHITIVEKPFDLEDLYRAVDAALRRSAVGGSRSPRTDPAS